MSRAAVAMSGGVDSAVAAALLVEQGRTAFGVTMRLFGETSHSEGLPVSRNRNGRCCGGEDVEIARQAAGRLNIPFFVLDFADDFKEQVIEDFVRNYRNGRTPIPCAHCNQELKFDRLLRRVRGMGAERLVTGHYARIHHDPGSGRRFLRRAVDGEKDQTYFLFGLTQENLEQVEFPVGGLHKAQVREVARRHGLPNADKPESQDICFIPDGDYRSFIDREEDGPQATGLIVDEEGRRLGTHGGLSGFTIGQRRGLGLGGGGRRFVVALHPEANRVVVGSRKSSMSNWLETGPVNWVSRPVPSGRVELSVQVRHRQEPVPATLQPRADGSLRIVFSRPVVAAPGQAAVFYDGVDVAGGGWIESSEAAGAGIPDVVSPLNVLRT